MKASPCAVLKPAILPGPIYSNFWHLLRPMCFITRSENQKKRQTCLTYGLKDWLGLQEIQFLWIIQKNLYPPHYFGSVQYDSDLYFLYFRPVSQFSVDTQKPTLWFKGSYIKSMSTNCSCLLSKTKTLTQNKIIIKWNCLLLNSYSNGYWFLSSGRAPHLQ